jgi:hypothetical protein
MQNASRYVGQICVIELVLTYEDREKKAHRSALNAESYLSKIVSVIDGDGLDPGYRDFEFSRHVIPNFCDVSSKASNESLACCSSLP